MHIRKFLCNFAAKLRNMSNKEIYEQLCQQENLPLFMQSWWLEGVSAGKDWDVLLVKEGETILAAMPIETSSFLWMQMVNPQEMSPYGGVWISPSYRDNPDKVSAICANLHQQMLEKKIRSYQQFFCIGSPAPAVLEGMGYKCVPRCTYTLEDLSDLEAVVNGFSRNKRKKLEKHTLTYSVRDLDPEEFYRFHMATCAQKKKKVWYTREMLLVLWEKTQEKKQSSMFGVYDSNNELLAAAFLVWDNKTAYQLLNSFDHDHPDNGAREMLTLESIKRARELGLSLDFTYHRDYLKHYGAKRKYYSAVYHGPITHTWVKRLVDWVQITFMK